MKKTLFVAFSLSLGFSSTVVVSNVASGASTDIAIVDSSGDLYNGYVSIGYFDSESDVTGATSISGLASAFNQFGSTLEMNSQLGSAGFFDFGSSPFSGVTITGSAFSGQSVYTIISDNSDLSQATSLAVWVSDSSSFTDDSVALGSGATPNITLISSRRLICLLYTSDAADD